jgi:hypothetical protein
MRIILVLAAIVAASGARAEDIPPQKVDGKINWAYSYAEGQRLARTTGKPLFVVFRCER